MSKLHEQLLKVQKDLKAPKGQFNKFGNFKYRSAEDILEAVKPLNADNGLLLTLTDEPLLIGEWHYIKATARITNGEETHEVTAYARESQDKKGMDHMQITGTASSYARKYALNGLYLIDDTKDADTDEYQSQNNKQTKQQEPNLNEQLTDYFTKAVQEFNGDKDKLYETLGKTREDMAKLYDSKNQKDKKAVIKKLEGIVVRNDNNKAG